MRAEADRIRRIQHDSVRKLEMERFMKKASPVNGKDTCAVMDLWNNFGSRLGDDDPCRQAVLKGLSQSAQAMISRSTRSSRATDSM